MLPATARSHRAPGSCMLWVVLIRILLSVSNAACQPLRARAGWPWDYRADARFLRIENHITNLKPSSHSSPKTARASYTTSHTPVISAPSATRDGVPVPPRTLSRILVEFSLRANAGAAFRREKSTGRVSLQWRANETGVTAGDHSVPPRAAKPMRANGLARVADSDSRPRVQVIQRQRPPVNGLRDHALRRVVPAVRAASSCRRKWPRKVVQIAVAFDHRVCARFGGSWARAAAAIRSVVAVAERPFSTRTCLLFRVSHIDGYCSAKKDVYAGLIRYQNDSGSNGPMLRFIRNVWQTKRTHVKANDVVVVFVGFTHRYKYGQADIASSCQKGGYAWVEGVDRITVAHEIGHLLGAVHDSWGIMNVNVNDKTPFRLSNQAVNSIVKYVDSNPLARCITTSHAPKPRKTSFCRDAFPKRAAFACAPARVSHTQIQASRISLAALQIFGKFSVTLRVRGAAWTRVRVRGKVRSVRAVTRIAGASLMLSTLPSSPSELRRKARYFGLPSLGKRTVFARKLSAAGLRTSGDKSCCNSVLYVHAFVKLRQTFFSTAYVPKAKTHARVVTTEKLAKLKLRLKCKYCGATATLVRASSTRRCPVCK